MISMLTLKLIQIYNDVVYGCRTCVRTMFMNMCTYYVYGYVIQNMCTYCGEIYLFS